MAPLTNKLGLPDAIVRAIANDGYSRGASDLTVTELIGPPRLGALRRAHEGDITEDAADRIWSLLGQAVHTILERAADRNTLTEERLFTSVRGWRVSGQLDHYTLDADGLLSDYKVSSVWSAKAGGKDEWTAQTNVLAYLLREHGFAVAALRIVLICRDWRKNEARRYGAPYPLQQVVSLPVMLWSESQVVSYLDTRVQLHQAARALYAAGCALPHCTADERWKRDTTWAVMKAGRKSAVKVCATEVEARLTKGAAPDSAVWIEERQGIATRCAQYCPVMPWCRALNDGQFLDGDLPADADDRDIDAA